MSDLNNKNTKALVHENAGDIDMFLTFFASVDAGVTWENWMPGDSAAFLEGLKGGLLGLAQCVEVRLQEIYAPDHEQTDFGV